MSHHRGRHRKPGKTAKVTRIIAPGVTTGAFVSLAVAASATGAQAQVLHAEALYPKTVQASVPVQQYIPRHAVLTSSDEVTVHPGDTLSGLAGRYCGNPETWTGWWNYNHKTLHWGNPDVISPGQHVIPDCRVEHIWLRQPAVTTADVQYHHQYSGTYSGGGNLSFGGLEALWVSAGGPAWAESSAAAVAECESGGRQYAFNPSGASGYWQILGEVVPGNVFDPMTNAHNAVSKFEASGDTWAQWVCQP